MNHKRLVIPPVGMRIMKSAVGVLLGFMIYEMRGRTGIPFYTALSVLWCIRPYRGDTLGMAAQRSIGTLIGGLYGLLVLVGQQMVTHGTGLPEIVRYVLISFMIIPIIHTTITLDRKNASYFACVVFLSITVLHMTDENPYIFVLNRMIDTEIGILIGMFLNMVHLPYRKNEDILFVSGVDDTLLAANQELTPYSRVELNRMLDEGAKFTLSTMRTPASLVQSLQGIRLKLPVICMDGAVLYDIRENRYLKKFVLAEDDAVMLRNLLAEEGFHVFINRILEDMWLIYYGEFNNFPEEDIYTNLRKSPYRNYLKKEPAEFSDVVYLMVVDTARRIDRLYEKLKQKGFTEHFKILKYPSDDYPGYSYIKIYHSDANRTHMMDYLAALLKVDDVITFGSVEGKYDVVVHANDSNKVVKTLKKLYEPCIFLPESGLLTEHKMRRENGKAELPIYPAGKPMEGYIGNSISK